MNIFNFKRVRTSTLIVLCLVIFAFCYYRGIGRSPADTVIYIKRFVHQHKKSLEDSIAAQNPHFGRHAIHRLSNFWVAADHPDSLKMDELTHCKTHVEHKLVELGLSVDKRDIKDMRHMNRTHEVDCTAYRHSADLKRQVHANVMEMPGVSDPATVTLVTHLTSDRFDKLLDALKHWTGPVSAAVYVREHENLEAFSELVCASYIEHNYKDFYLHFVKEEGVFYPVNYLRNTALNRVQTDYVFIMDVDFVPMPYLYETLHHYTVSGMPANDEALIVPAFEVIHEKKYPHMTFPQHKAEAIKQWKDGEIRPFHIAAFEHAHKPTDFPRWIQAKEPYQIEWKRWFEPYIVLKTDVVPKFDKHFVERGFDKSSHMMQLHAMGFSFFVTPTAFILHTPHSLANTDSFKDMRLNKCSREIHEQFLIHLGEEYNFFLSKDDLPKNEMLLREI